MTLDELVDKWADLYSKPDLKSDILSWHREQSEKERDEFAKEFSIWFASREVSDNTISFMIQKFKAEKDFLHLQQTTKDERI